MVAGQNDTTIIQSNTTLEDSTAFITEAQPQNPRIINLNKAQELIYRFLLNSVKANSPDVTLDEFKRIFIYTGGCNESSEVSAAVHEIIFANQEHQFRYTLKRSCYILINNWETKRQHQAIQQLVDLFQDPVILRPAIAGSLQRLRTWLFNFINSQDYQDLQTFVSRRLKQDNQADAQNQHWADRYAFYRLMAQSTDLDNPIEQQEAARNRALMLKNQFRFDLAMYIAKSQASSKLECAVPRNPTGMGDEVLRLIKLITLRRGTFSHENLANIFLKQTTQFKYKNFKTSLIKYLTFGLPQVALVEQAIADIEAKLGVLYTSHHENLIDDALLLRTCNRLIDYLTVEDRKSPSTLFKLLSHQHPFALITLLLKIHLICRNTASQLESRIGKLVQFYEKLEERSDGSEIKNPISFFEVFNIVFTIHTGNIEYSVVHTKKAATSKQLNHLIPLSELEQYRIFSRSKQVTQDQLFGT
ncbi:MAG: hypothetical protein ACTS2F_13125 [Thainema sp.]